MRFRDRDDGGRQLGERVAALGLADPVVLALPRGGVPVAAQVAAASGVGFEVFVARKIGAPGRPELGIGAVAEGLADPVVTAMAWRLGLSNADVAALARVVAEEIDRRVGVYRGSRSLPPTTGRDVVLVDDGLATGVTAEAGLRALREKAPHTLHFAAPVCARESLSRLAAVADGVVHVMAPDDLQSVGEWYLDFTQTSDEEVMRLLGER